MSNLLYQWSDSNVKHFCYHARMGYYKMVDEISQDVLETSLDISHFDTLWDNKVRMTAWRKLKLRYCFFCLITLCR